MHPSSQAIITIIATWVESHVSQKYTHTRTHTQREECFTASVLGSCLSGDKQRTDECPRSFCTSPLETLVNLHQASTLLSVVVEHLVVLGKGEEPVGTFLRQLRAEYTSAPAVQLVNYR